MARHKRARQQVQPNIGSRYRKVTETIYSSRVSPVGLRHQFKSFRPPEGDTSASDVYEGTPGG
jgi:hypothetical protein